MCGDEIDEGLEEDEKWVGLFGVCEGSCGRGQKGLLSDRVEVLLLARQHYFPYHWGHAAHPLGTQESRECAESLTIFDRKRLLHCMD